jgi:hypothetical protein
VLGETQAERLRRFEHDAKNRRGGRYGRSDEEHWVSIGADGGSDSRAIDKIPKLWL